MSSRTSVVFPAPFGPRRASTSPAPAWSETSSRAWVVPKRLLTPTTSMAIMVDFAGQLWFEAFAPPTLSFADASDDHRNCPFLVSDAAERRRRSHDDRRDRRCLRDKRPDPSKQLALYAGSEAAAPRKDLGPAPQGLSGHGSSCSVQSNGTGRFSPSRPENRRQR